MTDQFSTTTSRNYFQRLGDSFIGILIGFLLLVVAVILLFWNEGRALDASRGLSAAAKAAVSVANGQVLPANEGKLVHASGMTKTASPIIAQDLNVAVPNALAVARKVEMFQWVETNETKTKDKVGGTQETTVITSYTKKWHEGPVASADFKRPEGHSNPDMALLSQRDVAVDGQLGGFMLSADVIDLLPTGAAFVPAAAPEGWSKTSTGLFKGKGTVEAPNVGDLHVTFSITPNGPISVMGQQIANQFVSWASGKGNFNVLLASATIQAKEAMVTDAKSAEGLLTWILRLIGTLLCVGGFGLIMGPLKALGNMIPVLASVIGSAAGVVAFGLGSILALVVIACAWFLVRPLLSLVLIAISVAIVMGLASMRKAAPTVGAAKVPA